MDKEAAFTVSHPDWDTWCKQVAWEVRHTSAASAFDIGEVVRAMTALGFAVTPPPPEPVTLSTPLAAVFPATGGGTDGKAARLLKRLEFAGVTTLGGLASCSEADLLDLRSIGRGAVALAVEILAEYGLELSITDREEKPDDSP